MNRQKGLTDVLLLVADDHALVREGLKHTLRGLDAKLEILEASDAAEVVGCLTRHAGDLDLVLLDLVMPGSDGFDLLARVCNSHPDLPVAILSATADPAKMRKALDIGAAGFITKNAPAEVMLSALRLILAGGIYVPPEMLNGSENAAPNGEGDTTTPAVSLTARQCEVLGLLGEGKSNKQIARELDLSENTVKIHVAAILRTLGVSNRTQAAVVARERGIEHRPER